MRASLILVSLCLVLAACARTTPVGLGPLYVIDGGKSGRGMPPDGSDAGTRSASGDAGATPHDAAATTPQADGGADAAGPSTIVTIPPISISQCGASNPAGLSVADATSLMAGSGSAGSLRLLYPYDGTVFPRGLISPTVMWEGAADAVYLHIKSKAFEYKGCLKPTAPGVLQIPQGVWDQAAARTYGATDPYSLELSTLTAGVATGPVTLHFNVAQATVKGSIYYNSYSSMLAGAGTGGNVLRIPAGKAAEAFLSTDCNGCHSVSADGSRLISQIGISGGGVSYKLVQGGGANPQGVAAGPRTSYGALYPDGSKYLSTSGALEVARSNLTSMSAPTDATLYDTSNATVLTTSGIPAGALMPIFSPNGGLLAFSDFALDSGQALAIVDFDAKTNTGSKYREVYRETTANMKPAWPFFLPDDKGLIFLRTDSTDFSGGGAGIGTTGTANAPFGELCLLDLASGKATLLAQAMGYKTAQDAAAGTTYLPFGAEELHHSYFPTVSPVAAGGYFWVFFDTIRHCGNQGLQRQLWGAAIDVDAKGDYTVDRSHPAFYLPGQEFGTGNHRAFAALDPCEKDGDSCSSGIDCCSGACSLPLPKPGQLVAELKGTCHKPSASSCAKRDERCTTSAQCCAAASGEPALLCIGGFCAATAPGP